MADEADRTVSAGAAAAAATTAAATVDRQEAADLLNGVADADTAEIRSLLAALP